MSTHLRAAAATALLLLAIPPPPTTAQDKTSAPIRVFVSSQPNPGGFVDEASKGRTAAAGDITKALKRRKGLIITDATDQADITIEVTSRALEASSGDVATTTSKPLGQSESADTSRHKNRRVRAILTAGTYTTEIMGETIGIEWRRAAGYVADQIERWIRDNRDRLLAAR